MDAVEIQPERTLVKRLRMSAWLSMRELADVAGVGKYQYFRFETERASLPLDDDERQLLVAVLEALLRSRRNYPRTMRELRSKYELTIRVAAKLTGVEPSTWYNLERGYFRRFPYPSVRKRLENFFAHYGLIAPTDAVLGPLGKRRTAAQEERDRAEVWAIVLRNRALLSELQQTA